MLQCSQRALWQASALLTMAKTLTHHHDVARFACQCVGQCGAASGYGAPADGGHVHDDQGTVQLSTCLFCG